VRAALKKYKPELSGEQATALKHGIVWKMNWVGYSWPQPPNNRLQATLRRGRPSQRKTCPACAPEAWPLGGFYRNINK